MKVLTKLYERLEADRNLRRVVHYESPKLTVKLTRQRKGRANDAQHTFLLTVGKPNFVERAKIKALQKTGATFPVKALHEQAFPAKKATKKAAKK